MHNEEIQYSVCKLIEPETVFIRSDAFVIDTYILAIEDQMDSGLHLTLEVRY
jgi:hypothetical protein